MLTDEMDVAVVGAWPSGLRPAAVLRARLVRPDGYVAWTARRWAG